MSGSWGLEPGPISRRRFLGATGVAVALLAAESCGGARSTKDPAAGRLVYFDDFRRPAGPLGHGWIDAHTIDPVYQDPVGIVAGGVADLRLQGPADLDPTASGWRGAFLRETAVASGLKVITTVHANAAQATSGGGPLVHCVPGSTPWGIGAWYNVGQGLDWYELGLIGRRPGEFQYLDTQFAAPPTPGGLFTMELRSADGQVSLFAGGHRVCGPVPLPAELIGSTKHGGQIDVGSRAEEGVAQVRDVRIERYSGPATPDYAPAVIRPTRGVVKASAATSVVLDTPAGARPGDLLLAVLGFATNVTPAPPVGWGFYPASQAGGAGPRLTCYTRGVQPDEPASTTWTFPSSDVAAVMLRVTGANRRLPINLGFQANPVSSSAPAPRQSIVGPHRAGLWVGLAQGDATIGAPEGFEPVARTTAGGPQITMTLAQVPDWGRFSPPMTPPFGLGEKTVVPVGRLSVPAATETMHLQVLPQPSPLT